MEREKDNGFLPPLLDEYEEKCLIEKLGTDEDKEAKDALTNHNLRLVLQIANKFDGKRVVIEDLISIGTRGLIKAVNTYSKDMDIEFKAYVSDGIENEIRMYIEKNGIPMREITIEELLEELLNIDEAQVAETLEMNKDDISETMLHDIKRRMFNRFLNTISMEEGRVLELKYDIDEGKGTELSSHEIARKLGISPKEVLRMEYAIKKKLEEEDILRVERYILD